MQTRRSQQPSSVASNPTAPTPSEFSLAAGENLTVLAKRYGVSISDFERFDPAIGRWIRVDPSEVLQKGLSMRVSRDTSLRTARVKDGFSQKLHPPPPCVLSCEIYKVKDGETIQSIARAHGLSERYVLAANPNVNPKCLRIGQLLNVPRPRDPAYLPSIYTVKQGDNIANIEKTTGRAFKDIMTFNRIPQGAHILIGNALLLPPEGWDHATIPNKTPFTENFAFRDEHGKILVGTEVLGRRVNEAVSRPGNIRCTKESLEQLGLSKTDARIIFPTIKIEGGGFDAINTGPKDLLSCGMIQWRIGGEDLGKLLQKFKASQPEIFARCFCDYGVDVTSNGYVMYAGQVFFDQDCKTFQNEWFAWVFSRAGQNGEFQKAQAGLAAERLNEVRELIGSRKLPPLAVALTFDRHVNAGEEGAMSVLSKIPKDLLDGKHDDKVIGRLIAECGKRGTLVKQTFE